MELASYLHAPLDWVLSKDIHVFNTLYQSMIRNKSTALLLESVNLRASVWGDKDAITKWYGVLKGETLPTSNDEEAFVMAWGQRKG